MTMTSVSPEPETYGQYEVEHLLGRGAMGTVYAARDRRIGRRVALKTIRIGPDQFSDDSAADDFFKRLQREAEVSGSLLHPNIVTLYEAGYKDDRLSYLAMELVEGETLFARMKRSRPDPLPVDETLAIAEDVLRGLAHAHEKSIIHRDIKPANILIAGDGTAKIADFGIARPQDSSMTGAGALLGTPNYMPPEQVTGKAMTTRADLFSVGVVMYEMLTSVKPFAGSDVTAILHNILRQEVANAADVNPAVPRAVGDFIERLMKKSADARPTSAEALEQIAVLRRPVVAPTTPERRVIRPRHAALIVGAVLLPLLIAAGVIATRIDSSPATGISQSQLNEFDAKRRALAEAQASFDAGRFEESVQRYDAYLQKYPQSVAATEGRARAQAALDEQQKKSKKTRRNQKRDEDISPSELLNRLKRAIRR
jgi:serine/threonine protein kinase